MNTCIECQKQFEITPREQEFMQKVSPVIGGQRFEIPASPYCPSCRRRIRTSHRNEQFLYKNVSAKTGQSIVSIYAQPTDGRSNPPLYTHEEWWADDWDPATYGRDYDFSRNFFEQYVELAWSVPRVALIQVGNENCPYTTGTGYCKNCYLISCSENSEDCYYGKLIQTSSNVVDSSYVYDSQLLYQCFNVHNCYNCAYVYYSQNCTDCYFSENLVGCKNCFLSTNLRNKEFYFMNKPMKKEEYEKAIAEYLGTKTGVAKALEILKKMRQERIHKYVNVVNTENSTGDFLINCQNCDTCFDVNDSQDCLNLNVGVNVKDCVDCSNMYLKSELCYQVLGTIECYNTLFSLFIFHCQNILYSQFCHNSSNLFGCFGLRKKQYCIFNKQYTKEEYERLVPQIIEQMIVRGEYGLFFPMWMSPFGYNESVAYEFEPLAKAEAERLGYNWYTAPARDYAPSNAVVPGSIAQTPQSITSELLACVRCAKNYRIIEREYQFLKQMQMPIPSLCPDCRHFERLELRNPAVLYDRACNKCSEKIASTFAPNDPSIIYCEKCYLGEI